MDKMKEVSQDQSSAGNLAAHIKMVNKTTDDTRTSRTGRVIKRPTTFTPSPTIVASGKRKGASRKKEVNVVCVHCNRGYSPATNAIVFCDGCNSTYHQKCHDPPIDNQVIMEKDMEWHCRKCKPPPRPPKAKSQPIKVKKSTRILHPRLQAGPRLEVGGENFTPDDRRAYLSSLSHAQLVELLVNISGQNPSVPMFPTNMKDLPASKFFLQPPSNTNAKSDIVEPVSTSSSTKRSRTDQDSSDADLATGPRKRARTTSPPAEAPTKNDLPETNSEPSIPRDAPNSATPALATPSASKQSTDGPETPPTHRSQGGRASTISRDTTPEASDPDTDDEVFEDAVEDHRLYPRAGNGFSPAMSPEDLKILTESPDSHTFSHSMHGPAKVAQEMKIPPPVWKSHV